MDDFVCVRLIQANALDLGLFQFDYDMSFAAFFLEADKTILGRYGTRSARPKEADKDISLEGLREAMKAALALHADIDTQRETLKKKRGPEPTHATPLDFPSLDRFEEKLDYEGKLAGSCVHCHMISDAERKEFRDSRQPIPDKVLYPWPNPSLAGMSLRNDRRATLATVTPDSPAAKAGLQAGDEIVTMDGQPIISTADIQWVLHQSPSSAGIPLTARREGKTAEMTLVLEEGWRKKSDLSWRTSTWDLRRMALGGMVLESSSEEQRKVLGLNGGKLALRVQYTGKYNDHARAHNAGVKVEDILVGFGGIDADLTESELIARTLESHQSGDTVEAKVQRGNETTTVSFKLP